MSQGIQIDASDLTPSRVRILHAPSQAAFRP